MFINLCSLNYVHLSYKSDIHIDSCVQGTSCPCSWCSCLLRAGAESAVTSMCTTGGCHSSMVQMQCHILSPGSTAVIWALALSRPFIAFMDVCCSAMELIRYQGISPKLSPFGLCLFCKCKKTHRVYKLEANASNTLWSQNIILLLVYNMLCYTSDLKRCT